MKMDFKEIRRPQNPRGRLYAMLQMFVRVTSYFARETKRVPRSR